MRVPLKVILTSVLVGRCSIFNTILTVVRFQLFKSKSASQVTFLYQFSDNMKAAGG